VADTRTHVLYDPAMSSHKASGGATDRLGKFAMLTIAGTILLMVAVVLAAKGVDGFPYGVYGLIAAGVLFVVSLAVSRVE
jgi:hypothetical protein